MTAKSRFRFGCLLLAGTTSAFLTGWPVSAQQAERNHLDCWFDAAMNAVQCPSHPIQEGRGARIDPDRVDRAFDMLDPPELPIVQPPGLPSPGVRPLPAPRPEQAGGARVERRAGRARSERAKAVRASRNPGCRNYRTYNPASQTYRGYDGVVRRCQPAR